MTTLYLPTTFSPRTRIKSSNGKNLSKILKDIDSDTRLSPIKRAYVFKRILSEFKRKGIHSPAHLRSEISGYEERGMLLPFCSGPRLSNFENLDEPDKISFEVKGDSAPNLTLQFPDREVNSRVSRAFLQFYISQHNSGQRIKRNKAKFMQNPRTQSKQISISQDSLIQALLPFLGGDRLVEILEDTAKPEIAQTFQERLSSTNFGYVIRDTLSTHILFIQPKEIKKTLIPKYLTRSPGVIDEWIYTLSNQRSISIESQKFQKVRETLEDVIGEEPSILECLMYGMQGNPLFQKVILLDNYQTFRGVFSQREEVYQWIRNTYKKPNLTTKI